MRNYDFHELMSDKEFQKFAASLLEIKEQRQIRSNAFTKDEGIDIYDLNNEIIGQVKNYQNNFQSLKSSLKKEVIRAKTIKPKRYILITSSKLSKSQKEEIVKMFEGYLKYEDILDYYEINYLLEKEEYKDLEIKYLKLLVPNSFVLSYFLEKAENKKIYTQTEIELDKIRCEQQIFTKTENFDEALEKLEKNHTIIISGPPGVGKSILGRMLSAYIINQNKDTNFFSVSSTQDLYQIYNNDSRQVYFFDDFFGDTKFNYQISSLDNQQLIDFIEYINKSNNKYLIITTREYILKDGININIKNKEKYLTYEYRIDIKDISRLTKFNILLSHLKLTPISWQHINIILKFWREIIDNPNYTPRLIETFLNNYNKYKNLSAFDFFKKFDSYITKPYDYWSEILNKESNEIIVLLMKIALENEKMKVKTLNLKYNEILKNINKEVNTSNNIEDIIKRLENTFTITTVYDDEVYIEFKNPSYKDFILEYLSKNLNVFISYLYNDELNLTELINIWKSINTNYDLYKNIEEVKKIDEKILEKLIKDKDWLQHLIELAEYTSFTSESYIKNYIIKKAEDLLEDIEDNIYFDDNAFNLTFILIEKIHNKYDLSNYIYNVIDTVTWESQDFYTISKLVDIKKMYPEIYNQYYIESKKIIKESLYRCAIDDALYYKNEKDILGIENLKYEQLNDVYKELNIKIPQKLKDELDMILHDTEENLEDLNTENMNNNLKYKVNSSKKDISKEKEEKMIMESIQKIIGENKYIGNVNKYLIDLKKDKDIINEIKKLENNNYIISSLLHYKDTLLLIYDYLEDYKNKKENIFNIASELSNNIVNFLENITLYINKLDDITQIEYYSLAVFAYRTYENKKVIYTYEEAKEMLKIDDIDLKKLLNSKYFVKKDRWYHLIHPLVSVYIFLTGFQKLNFNFGFFKIIDLIENCNNNWNEIDNYYIDNIVEYRLMKEMFPNKWKKEIEQVCFEYFMDEIDKKDEISIATSILKFFSLNINYNYDYTYNIIYKNSMINDILILNFDCNILSIFDLSNNMTDSLENFLNEFYENSKTLEVNRYIHSNRFINILIENDYIKKLNDIYKLVENALEKDMQVC